MNEKFRALVDLDRVIHEPARLMIVAVLSAVEWADFVFLLNETGQSKGNLATHLTRLQEAAYIDVNKQFRGKVPQTQYRLTPGGRTAFENYCKAIKSTL
jgi:DNA-binding transcriptional ArsR family regulator